MTTMKVAWTICFLVCMAVFETTRSQKLTQTDLDRISNDLKVKVKVLDNTLKSAVSHNVRMTLGNTGSSDLPTSGWKLYFHSIYLLYPAVFPNPKFIELELEKVRVSMIQGDLYSMQPMFGFKAIQPNEDRVIDVTVAFWTISRTDFMPQWYVTGSDDVTLQPRIVQSTASMNLSFVEPFDDVRQWKRYDFDRYNPYTAQQRFRRIQVSDTGKVEKLVIPTPKTAMVSTEIDGVVSIDNTWTIYNNSVDTSSVAAYLSKILNLGFTHAESGSKIITLKITPTVGDVDEAYNLNVHPNQKRVELEGRDARGLFYAAQSLISIIDGYDKQNIPKISIFDEPRYPLRGMHVDVTRNFHGVDDIKRIIDAMAMYKLNSLHLHLSDDEGWRLDIPSIPELALVGGKRCHDLSEYSCIIPQYGSGPFLGNSTSGSGFYTAEDYKTILRYALERHIEIVPEFDMPGHAHAAIISMERRFKDYKDSGDYDSASQYRLKDPDDTSEYLTLQYWRDNAINPCMESTYAFIGRLLDDVIKLHSDIQPLKTFHFGGDEQAEGAWENSTICQSFLREHQSYNVSKGLKKYFVERVSRLTRERGVAMRGWEDGLMDGQGQPFAHSSFNNPNISANAWNNVWEWGNSQRAHTLANAGYKVVMSQATHFYFDHPYEPDPEERGFYWAPRFTDTFKTFSFLPDSLYDNIDVSRSGEPLTKAGICGHNMEKCEALTKPQNILGLQGQLWSETVRTSENLDYMIFPRMLALAERAWHKAPFESSDVTQRNEMIGQEWQAFANTIGYKELARLDKLGVKYRVPPPGARVENGEIEVATTFPGLSTEISYDNGVTWTVVSPSDPRLYPESGTVHLRTRSKDNLRYSRTIELYKDEPVTWSDRDTINYIGDNVKVYVAVIDNLNKTDNFITMQLQLENTGSDVIKSGTWAIYLYSLYGLKHEVLDCGLRTGHVNGGLYYVTPNNNSFPGIQSGETLTCIFHNKWWSVSRLDQFPNWYVSSLGMKPKVIKNTEDDALSFVGSFDTEKQWKRTTEDQYNPLSPEQRYALFERSTGSTAPTSAILLPTPFNSTVDASSEPVQIGAAWRVYNSPDFGFAAKLISEKLNITLQNTMPQRQMITFVRRQTDFNVTESYHVDVDPGVPSITITANDRAGALYAAQTVIALVQNNGRTLRKITIKDKPRFSYRGVMIDTARNFKPKEWMFKMLDVMAMYKLNKLHFHLTDDEGWRFEIPGIPELTKISSNRCHSDYNDTCTIPQLGSGPTNTVPGSGFYSIQEYRNILQYATDRNIEIIPEVDMPGHSAAAIQAMSERDVTIAREMMHGADVIDESFSLTGLDENGTVESSQMFRRNTINPCLNSTYDFVRKLVEGVKALHAPIMPLKSFHIGGDEIPEGIWDTSAACKALHTHPNTQSLQREFVRRVADIVASFDLDLAVWEDGVYADNKPNPISDYKSSNVFVYPWDSVWEFGKAKRGSEFADEGYKVILPLATHLYFDMPQEPDPEELGLYWATRVTDVRKVFGFMPDNIFANADVTRMGEPVSLSEICNNAPCPMPTKPENIIGIQGALFSVSMRTEEQWHYMGFPRILALAERAWHKASWEDTDDKTLRNSLRDRDFDSFIDLLGEQELPRLDQSGIAYRVAPPGAKIEMDVLKVNTRFPNHPVEYSTDGGQSWTEMGGSELNMTPGTYTVMLRSRSPTLNRYSRVISIRTSVVSAAFRPVSLTYICLFLSAIIISVLF